MEIEYHRGDFIDGNEFVIVHGCNAQGVMGRGVAKAVKDRLPFAYEAYRDAFEDAFTFHWLGDVIWAIDVGSQHRPRIVGNMITQEYWRQSEAVDGRNVDYDAVRQCMQKVRQFVEMTQDKETIVIPPHTPIFRVGMPLVGCGLGGGKWPIVKEIIEAESADFFTPIVYLLDGILPTE